MSNEARMKRYRFLSISLIYLSVVTQAFAQPPTPAYPEEPYLHPAGFPSADVLRGGEKLFAPQGWLAYGINDRLTATMDWLITLFAVPAAGLRYQLPDKQERFSHAIDAYSVVFARGEVESLDVDEFKVKQTGWQGWLHYNTTVRLAPKWRWHNYAGFTYDTYQRYIPENGARFTEDKIEKNYVTPDVGTGIEYQPRAWLKLNANVLHGNNFYVFDQNPHHYLVQYSIQMIPFRDWKNKFFSGLRIELFGFYVDFYKIDYETGIPPFYPVLRWQWQ